MGQAFSQQYLYLVSLTSDLFCYHYVAFSFGEEEKNSYIVTM